MTDDTAMVCAARVLPHDARPMIPWPGLGRDLDMWCAAWVPEKACERWLLLRIGTRITHLLRLSAVAA